MLKITITILVFLNLFLGIISIKAQGEIDEQDKIIFRNERSYGFELKSNGWGVDYRYAKRTSNYKKKWFYTAGLSIIKDKKEIKSFNSISLAGGRFVYGKINYVFALQSSIGKQIELFTKFDQSSVSIRILYEAGVNLAFQKPIYYKVLQADGTKEEQLFALNIPPFMIEGRSNFFKGISGTTLSPGVFGKASASFDYGKRNNKLNLIEVGTILNFFPAGISIMQDKQKLILIPSVFLSIRMGKVISDYHIKEIEEE